MLAQSAFYVLFPNKTKVEVCTANFTPLFVQSARCLPKITV